LKNIEIEDGICEYSYDSCLQKLLYNPKLYAKIDLYTQNKFKSKHALFLYELACDYKDDGQTPWIDKYELKEYLGLNIEQYADFGEFNRRVIKKAIKEINEKSGLTIDTELLYLGDSVYSVKFIVDEQVRPWDKKGRSGPARRSLWRRRVTCHTDHVGPGSTFVAIDGFDRKGSLFVDEAIARGATRIVLHKSEQNLYKKNKKKNVEYLFVDDCRVALAELSRDSLNNPASKLKIIGITGTKGKTTTAFLIEHLLRQAGYKTAMLGSIKNKILDKEIASSLTTPESDYLHVFFDECVKQNIDFVVMEVSSHAIALKRTHGILFDVIAFTNLAPEHIDFHETMDDYFATKYKLFSQVKKNGLLVINDSDSWGKRAIDMQNKVKRNYVVESSKKFDVTKNNITGLSLKNKINFDIPKLFGKYNAQNISMAYTICKKLNLSEKIIKDGLKTFNGIPGRQQLHKLKNGAIACVDFAHNPSSFQAILSTLRPLTNNLIVIFGCGGNRDKTKRPVMGELASKYGDKIIITNDNPRDEDHNEIIKNIYSGVPEEKRSDVVIIPDRKVAIDQAVKFSHSGSIIAILGKGHESYNIFKDKKYYFDDFEQISNY
jgi:UDP-N-acetylmuramoyl-L-alanyl-D-glutamate--2,6-diaminopimelate ligase